jgi:hypothetical protein
VVSRATRRLTLTLALACPVALRAQSTDDGERVTDAGYAHWLTAWSPLAPIAEHPRSLVRLGAGPQLLVAPAPRVGLARFARHAAALPLEIRDTADGGRFEELRLRAAHDAGDYRRPLDAPAATVLQGAGLGWRTLGTRGAGIGRVVVDREAQGESPPTSRVQPYTSSPFVVADTLDPEVSRARARLEGMAGWRVLGFGVGLAAGVDTREVRSIDTPLRRGSRATRQALGGGVSRALPWMGLVVGAHARWQEGRENASLVPGPGQGIAFSIRGYAEPDSLVVATTSLIRRIDARADAAGVGAGARVLGAEVVAYADVTSRRERHAEGSPAIVAASPRDRWSATGREWGVAVQRRAWGERALLTGWARGSSLEGDARRPDLEGIIFTAEESRVELLGEARLALPGSRWRFALQGGTTRDAVTRLDYVASLRSDVVAWRPSLHAEAARTVGASAAVSLALGARQQATSSTIPRAADQGPVYRGYVAPALAVDAGAATVLGGALTARWRLRDATWWVALGAESLSRAGAELSSAPEGSRTLWSMAVGVRP